MIRYYQFTPQLAISLITSQHSYSNYFDSEYWFAKTSKKIPVNIELRIVDTLTNHSDNLSVVFRSVKFKNLFWFEYEIDFGKKPIQIYVKRHFMERFYFKAFGPFIQTNILEPVLYFVAIAKKQYLLHAATVSENQHAVCIAGKGGAGKTTTALTRCVTPGVSFMGDDLIFIDGVKRQVYWFPRPLHLFSYNLFKIPRPTTFGSKFLFCKLVMIIKLKDMVRAVLQFFTKQRILISTRVDVRLLYPKMFLERTAQFDHIESLKLNPKNLAHDLLKASDLRSDLMTLIKKLPHAIQEDFLREEERLVNLLCS